VYVHMPVRPFVCLPVCLSGKGSIGIDGVNGHGVQGSMGIAGISPSVCLSGKGTLTGGDGDGRGLGGLPSAFEGICGMTAAASVAGFLGATGSGICCVLRLRSRLPLLIWRYGAWS
jgi:hypothetical protein